MKTWTLLTGAALLLSGCAITTYPAVPHVVAHQPPPHHVVVPVMPAPAVVITNGSSGRFCPPGQAKKGNC